MSLSLVFRAGRQERLDIKTGWETCGAGLLAIRGVGVAWREKRVGSFSSCVVTEGASVCSADTILMFGALPTGEGERKLVS